MSYTAEDIPKDVLLEILTYFNVEILLNLRLVSKNWYKLCNDEKVSFGKIIFRFGNLF